MQKDVEEFNRSVEDKRIDHFDLILNKVRECYKDTFSRVRFEKNMIEEEILPFLRYEKENLKTSKEVIESGDSLLSKYVKRSQNEP